MHETVLRRTLGAGVLKVTFRGALIVIVVIFIVIIVVILIV